MQDARLVFNGIDGITGEPMFDPLPLAKVAAAAGMPLDDASVAALQETATAGQPHYGLGHGRGEAESLRDAGWAVVYAKATPRLVRDALEPLVSHRKGEAGERFREYTVDPKTSKDDFLMDNGAGFGPVDPDNVPYYVLLVGGPETIPFAFQYELGGQYAVGRLAFDRPEEYGSYAESVLAAEVSTSTDRRLHCFAPARPTDRATTLSSEQLVAPLAPKLAAEAKSWTVEVTAAACATKQVLADALWGRSAPALLFTASHGVGSKGKELGWRERQGALVTYEWPGPKSPVAASQALAAADVPADRPVGPRVVFAFACYSAGTPALGGSPFVARLPQRLLGHPEGGALAFVGHVDQAYGCSFAWPDAGQQHEHFRSTLLALTDGWRVGHAMDYFAQRHLDVTLSLNGLLDRVHNQYGDVDPVRLARLWTASLDARHYVVLGDPAVRAVAQTGSGPPENSSISESG